MKTAHIKNRAGKTERPGLGSKTFAANRICDADEKQIRGESQGLFHGHDGKSVYMGSPEAFFIVPKGQNMEIFLI